MTMCLGVPMKVIEIKGPRAVVELGGLKREVSVELLDEVEPGQWVIVHAGFAIETLSEDEARETLQMINEVLEG